MPPTFLASWNSPYLALIVPCLVAFLICLVLLPIQIALSRGWRIGQPLRAEGPASHRAKAETPTAGGICFLIAVPAAVIAWSIISGGRSAWVVLVVSAAVACGLIGLSDDLAKLTWRSNRGLSARMRLLLEVLVGCLLGGAIIYLGGDCFIPLNRQELHSLDGRCVIAAPIYLFVAFSGFLVVAATNAFNLHDGMDGLAAGTAAPLIATMALMLFDSGQLPLSAVASAACGCLAAFLAFNCHPARIFMGDTGSLFIGALLAALALVGRLELWFVLLALIYIAETLSVILQVVYFKLTKEYVGGAGSMAAVWVKLTCRLPGEGRRLFRMAPLHHHFEAVGQEQGVAEWKVVMYFWLAQMLICLVALALYYWL